MMQRMLRMDSIALAWQAWMILPIESVASWTLTADILAGRTDPTDLDPRCQPARSPDLGS